MVRTFSRAIGSQKLGHPVPDSNFVSELNKALSQQMQRYSPLSCRFQYFPLKAISVSAWRVISNCPGDSCLRHSSSLFTTLGTWTFCSRFPESENCTIVTSPGTPFGIAASISRGLCIDHNAAPAIAETENPRNARRLTLTDE